MKKIMLSALLLTGSLSAAWAGPISPQRASDIAARVFERIDKTSVLKVLPRGGEIRLDHTVRMDTDLLLRSGTRDGSSQACFYVFNRGKDAGFAIISADDLVSEVLAYSDRGHLDMADLPENLASYLKLYQEEIKLAIATGSSNSQLYAQSFSEFPEAVLPLFDTGEWAKDPIRWFQGYPFNHQLPSGGALVGCVATAAAQIMRYYTWPDKSQGEHTYSPASGGGFHVTFGNTYDWANMPGTLPKVTTQAQTKAFSTLLRDVGLAVDMVYKDGISIAWPSSLVRALRENFKFKKSLRMFDRHTMTAFEWQKILRKELSEKRPVFYTGESYNYGHAFVCDGYNAEGMYHFNWGWNGKSNGYFRLTNLHPAGYPDFTVSQEIIVGIEPEKKPGESELAPLDFRLADIYKQNGTTYSVQVSEDKLSAVVRLICINEYDAKALAGLRITRPDNSVVDVKSTDRQYTFTFRQSQDVEFVCDRSLLQTGRNKVSLITKRPDEPDSKWNPVFPYAGTPHPFFYVNVGEKIEVEMVPSKNYTFTITKLEAKLIAGGHSVLKIQAKNEGIDERREALLLNLVPVPGSDPKLKSVSLGEYYVEIPPNSEPWNFRLEFSAFKAKAGKYQLMGRFYSETEWTILGEVEVAKSSPDPENVNDISKNEFLWAYPNPTKGLVHLENTSGLPTSYALYSMDGRMLLQGVVPATGGDVDLSALPVATYLLRLGKLQMKIVKQ